MTAQETILTNQVTLDGTGGGSCRILVEGAGIVFAPRLAIVSTSTATKLPECILYRGSAQAPVTVLDNTFTGNGDSTGKVGGTLYYTGQAIWAVWSGGDPGAQALLQVYGQIGAQSDLLQAGPVGPSFNASAMSPAQVAAGLINSTLSTVIAAAIQNAGVPPIDHPAGVSIIFGQTVVAGGDFVSARISVAQYQSIVGTFFAQETTVGRGTNPYYRVRLQWSLVADRYDPLWTEDWVPTIGPFSFTSNYRNDYASPCYGDTLTISIHNYDSKDLTLTWGLFGSYRTRTRSVMRGRYPDDLSGESTGLGSDNILASWATPSVAPGGSASFGPPIQLFEGPVTVSGNTSVGTGRILILPQPNPAVLGGALILQTNSGGFWPPTPVILPRRTCTLQFQLDSTAPGNAVAQIQIVGQVQPG